MENPSLSVAYPALPYRPVLNSLRHPPPSLPAEGEAIQDGCHKQFAGGSQLIGFMEAIR
jgi:hypothetical protein